MKYIIGLEELARNYASSNEECDPTIEIKNLCIDKDQVYFEA